MKSWMKHFMQSQICFLSFPCTETRHCWVTANNLFCNTQNNCRNTPEQQQKELPAVPQHGSDKHPVCNDCFWWQALKPKLLPPNLNIPKWLRTRKGGSFPLSRWDSNWKKPNAMILGINALCCCETRNYQTPNLPLGGSRCGNCSPPRCHHNLLGISPVFSNCSACTFRTSTQSLL